MNNIGVAAHIHAAAKGGPRYLSSMSPYARASIQNGLWLCSNCAAKIDRDTDLFNAEMLRAWKADAERKAIEELGRRLPSDRDALDQLSMALTGQSVRFIGSAISNIHLATQEYLERLDPRFNVKSSYSNCSSAVTILAREPVPFSIKVPDCLAESWVQGMSSVTDYGRPARLSLEGAVASGSPLMEFIASEFGPGSTLSVSPIGRSAVVKMKFRRSDDGRMELFDDLLGSIFFARREIRFEGVACGGLVAGEILIGYSEPEGLSGQGTINIRMNPESWIAKSVRSLPYFERVHRLWKAIAIDSEIGISLELDGRILFDSQTAILDAATDYFHEVSFYLDYLVDCARLAERLGVSLDFKVGYTLRQREAERIKEILSYFDGVDLVGPAAVRSPIVISLARDAGGLAAELLLLNGREKRIVIQRDLEPVVMMGELFELPLLRVQLEGVLPVARSSEPETHEADIRVECQTLSNFRCSQNFIDRQAGSSRGMWVEQADA